MVLDCCFWLLTNDARSLMKGVVLFPFLHLPYCNRGANLLDPIVSLSEILCNPDVSCRWIDLQFRLTN